MYDKGTWNDKRCDELSAAVCINATGPNHTFVFISQNMTWAEAQSYCRANHRDLASVRNEAENQQIKDLVPPGQKVWIGLFRDSWKWSDGTNSSYTYWNDYEPNNIAGKEACVAANIDPHGKWEDWNCDTTAAFICYGE
ncbi:lactose-binding lectin l-2-like [Centropristis striata]|uniref:lactose-binding lectin l-2-like n=1 Tax=Centropristis striata TaxID=184440 RepID=UPI0027DED4B4|nr:lactose-binding lectin l-2-like [Centropristis striata]